MAAGPYVSPDKAILNYVSATNLLGANPANFKLSLHGSSWTPNDGTAEVFADATNELSTGGGYTAGGASLTNVTVTQTSGVVKFSADPVVFTATGSGIPAWRRSVIRYNGTLNGKVNPIVAYSLGDDTPADVPITTSGNTLTVTPNINGIIGLTRV